MRRKRGKIVHITQEHIERGIKGRAFECPLALALREAGWPEAMVGSDDFWLSSPGALYALSPRAKRFIRDFDSGEPVEPFSVLITAKE